MFNSNSTSQNFPLSLNLQALYLDILKRPENRAYNYAYVYKIKGILNISLLKKALYKIISKRTTLNTFFLEIGGIPYQSIQKNRSPNFKIIDGTKFPKKKLEALLEKEVSSYFDIYCPPLYKFILIKKEEDLFYLIAKFHHLIMDGTCLEAAFHELSNAYNEPDIIQLKNLTPLEIQDWLKYENSISNEERETSSEFWKKYLANSNINYSLASPSRGKKDRQLHLICKFYFQLSSSLSRMIKDFSQKYNISIFRILLTTYCALLWRYTKEDDITLSYPLNLRREKFEDLFGYYTGKQPFRVQIYENDSFEELLVKVKESLNLCKIILPYVYTMGKQSLSYSNIEFGKSNFLTNALRLKGLQINRIKHNKSYAISDLAFLYDDATQKIEFDVHFNQEKYDDSFIQEFCNHFRVFLERQLQDPKILISTIPFLTENELHKLLIQWNDTKKDHEENVTIHQLFERQVEKTPDKIAIICDDQAITYQELSTRANKLAHYLREKGVNSDTCVAINCKRSIDLIIGILSILKAGGAYVPLDPSYPKERLRYILEDTKAPLIITESHLIDQLSGIDIDIVALETAQKTLESYPETNLSESSQPHNLAYVIYTSGSTGEPKGVLIEHNSICNRLLWLQDDIKLSQEDIYLHQFSFCFDGAVVSLWWPLVYGTTIIVPSSEGLSDGEYLARIISQKSVSTLFCTPSMMNVLLNYSKLHEVQSINKVILGGETFPKKLFEKLQILKGCKLYNFYGPTECSVMSSYYDATSKMIVTPTVPIGRPVANTYIYILDAFRHPPPVGAVGEIYIGGKGLARGYLNRQTLTEERFIFSPFMNDKGEQIRLYRTGDLGRYLPDGNIEHLGRNDDQVKLRGFRIELKEIEAILLRHPDIKEAIVTVLQDSEKDKTLVSYVVLKESVQPVSENLKSLQIKEHIQKFLPEYMVPNIIMFLEKLPLTLNGKIDKHALSKLNYVSSSNTRVPRNQIEQDIRQIWSKILRLPVSKIGIQDDFFRLGGDSIDGIELVILLRQELGLNLTIRDIFNYKTIEKLYDYVEDNQLYVKATSSIKHEEGTLSGNVPFLPIQKLFFASNFAAPHHWNQSFLLKVNHLEIKKLERCIYELIKHHDNFRLRYKTENKSILNHLKNNSHEYTQYYDSEAKPEKLKVLDIRSLRYKEGTKDFDDLLQSILTGWQGNFNLEQGPTYSIGYIYGYADGSARIHFAFHHLIIDTVSWRILTNDLENLYNDKKLEVKTSSYRQWVKAVRDYAKDNKRERAYWQKVLSDYSPDSLTIFTKDKNNLNLVTLTLTQEETISLLRECNKFYGTQINDILLAALGHTLSKITSNNINHILLEGHGREQIYKNIDVTRTVGWFTTVFPVRLETKKNLRQTLHTTKEILEQIPNKGVGFGALIGYRHISLPKISFNYLGQFDKKPSSNNLKHYWYISDEASGTWVHPDNFDQNILNIIGKVIDGKMKFEIASKLNKVHTQAIVTFFENTLKEIAGTQMVKSNFLNALSSAASIAKPALKVKSLVQEIARNNTVSSLKKSNLVSYSTRKVKTVDHNQILLRDDIKIYKAKNECIGHLKEKRTIKNVLLTGVTGFLGRYLLIELLNLTNCNIYCIIRTDANFNDPQAKLNHILRTSGYEAYVNSPRIYCLAGNLEEKRLGLDAFIFENLENIIDSIYHCGACVHHLHAYETLRAANTLSTVELIKFALTKKIKELHYISTTSTILFSKYKKARIDLKEFEKPADIGPSKCGYLQSKWASEQILWSYIEKNLPFFIYRTGNITGHSLTGYCLAKDNHNLLLIKSFMQNKIAPRWNIPFEMTPVDIVSKSIVKISLYKNECNKKVFNIHNHNNISWEKYIKHIVISTNLKIKFVDKEEWRLNILPNLGPNNAIWPLKEFYQSLQLNGRFIERNILFLIDNKFLKIMKKLDICYPKKRDYSALINLYIDFLKNNFLENIVV